MSYQRCEPYLAFRGRFYRLVREIKFHEYPEFLPAGRYWMIDELDGRYGEPTGWTEIADAASIKIMVRRSS